MAQRHCFNKSMHAEIYFATIESQSFGAIAAYLNNAMIPSRISRGILCLAYLLRLGYRGRYPACVLKRQFSTSDLLYWQAAFAVIIVQYMLCHDGIVCRGYPPMTEREIYKMLASPLFVWLPAVFGNRVTRMRGVTIMSGSSILFLMMIYFNHGIVPSLGSHSGPIAVLLANIFPILICGIVCWPLGFFCHYFYERVLGDLWRMIWILPTESVSFSETWRLAWGRNPTRIAG